MSYTYSYWVSKWFPNGAPTVAPTPSAGANNNNTTTTTASTTDNDASPAQKHDLDLRLQMRSLRQARPGVDTHVKGMATIVQLKRMFQLDTDSNDELSAAGAAATRGRKSDEEFLALTARFKREGWSEERYTRELMALRERRKDQPHPLP